MKLYTKSRDGILYEATAVYDNGIVIVNKGSKINIKNTDGFKPKKDIVCLRNDTSLFDKNGILLKDISFNSLSSAATFVTGRIANGMIVWKTENGKYVRLTILNKEE